MLQQKIIDACTILGINTSANLPQIKRAYWQKVKLVHPDVNTSADAHEKFIQLTAAYDFLNNVLYGIESVNEILNKYKVATNTSNACTTTNTTSNSSYNNQQQGYNDALKQEALKAAQQRYYTFVNSAEYKLEAATDIFLRHVQFFLLVLLYTVFLIYAAVTPKSSGAYIFIFGSVLLLPFLFLCVYKRPKISFKNFNNSFKVISTNKFINIIIVFFPTFIITLILLGFYGGKTIVPWYYYLFVLTISASILVVLYYSIAYIKKRIINWFKIGRSSFLASIIVLNSVVLLNFYITPYSTLYVENFAIPNESAIWAVKNVQPIQYRIFDDYAGIANERKEILEDTKKDLISLQFKRGLLGLLVFQGYTKTNVNNEVMDKFKTIIKEKNIEVDPIYIKRLDSLLKL